MTGESKEREISRRPDKNDRDELEMTGFTAAGRSKEIGVARNDGLGWEMRLTATAGPSPRKCGTRDDLGLEGAVK
jgi:hypothetical protein